MIKETVLQQKQERDRLLLKSYVPREQLGFAERFLGSDLVKVISGPRRAGKSVFSILLLRNRKFAYLNFDDENLLKIENYDEIVKVLFEVYPDAEFFLFDEIQNMKNWELFVNKLQRRDFNIILTGSNAQLLNKELSSALTGRYIPIEIFPFSFREFLSANNFEIENRDFMSPETKGKILNYLDNYIRNGGFPEVVVNKLEPETYLETLFDSILLKDVVRKYKVRFPDKLYDIATYLISNFSCPFSFTKLKNVLGFRSTNTVAKYIRYMEESYLVFSLKRFSFKTKEQLKAPKKIYLIDNGFISAKSSQFSRNYGRLIENFVFVEILRRGYKLNKEFFYYKGDNSSEVDFVLKKGIEVERLIQVCYDAEDIETRKRELKGLIKASQNLDCDNLEVITWDYETEENVKGKKIIFVPLWKWLVLHSWDHQVS